jgi:hypothetical protein
MANLTLLAMILSKYRPQFSQQAAYFKLFLISSLQRPLAVVNLQRILAAVNGIESVTEISAEAAVTSVPIYHNSKMVFLCNDYLRVVPPGDCIKHIGKRSTII